VADLVALTDRKDESASRGQLILVSAFALAVIFLALAVIVNSAIFTQNLATRSENVEATEALDYRHSIEQSVGDLIGYVNEYNATSDTALRQNLSAETQNLTVYTGIQQVERGVAVSLGLLDTTNGTRIFQNSNSEFASNESNDDWTLAESVSNTRAFEIQVTNINNEFTVIANDTSTPSVEWEMELDDDEVTVTRDGNTSDCEIDEDIESVDVTGATVNGEVCPALIDTRSGDSLRFAAGISGDYAVEFEDGDEIEGNYSLVVDNASTAAIRDNDYAKIGGPGNGPYATPAVYSARVAMDYETPRLEYQTEIVAAPGEST
jgi:hypothetical protein